jgi:outer membrane protein
MRDAIGAALLALLMGVSAPTARAETLADALASAYENSGLLDQNRALLRAADEDVAQAMASLLPIINWSATASTQTPRATGSPAISAQFAISAQLLLYDFGRSQLVIDAQKEQVLGTRQALIGVEQQVLLNAVQAYMNLRLATAFVSLGQNNVRVISQELQASQDRFDVGEVTRTDVAQAQAQLAAAQSNLAASSGQRAQAVEAFRAAVGRAPGDLSVPPLAPVSRSVEDAKAYAVRNHPDILQAQHIVTASELAIQAAEAAMRATVNLTGRVGFDQDFNSGAEIGVTVGGPLYRGGLLSSQVRQAMAGRDQARASLHLTATAVQQQVGNAYASLQVARASRQASEQQVRAAQVAFDGVKEEATLGARTTLDVLNAEQTLLNARANLISAQVDEVNSSYLILSAMGLLTAQNLGLAVQIYDPTAYYNLVKDAPTATSAQGQALDRVLQAIGKE